jgi:hypothetical protein
MHVWSARAIKSIQPHFPRALQQLIPARCRRKRSVEAWIVCEETAYRFHISNLYKEVLPDQCYFKVSQRSQRVTLILKKYETNPWRFLRS